MIQKIIRAMIGIFGFVLGFTIYSSLASTFPVLLFGIEKGTILISAVVAKQSAMDMSKSEMAIR